MTLHSKFHQNEKTHLLGLPYMKMVNAINRKPMISPYLSIIIVNWNSKDYLQNCIKSIIDSVISIEYEIIVIDSASFDGCGEMLQCLYPTVRFIQSELNVGFARANNLGVSYACGDLLLFLNPDTEVRGHAIERLYSSILELPHAGVVGCRLLNSDGTLQTSCVMPLPTILNQVLDFEVLQRWFPKIGLWLTAETFEEAISPTSVEAISGACMMMNRECFERVGGFSTDYFMYAEDLDLCYKTISAGFTNYYVSSAEILHHGGGSTQHRRSSFSNVMMRESMSRLLKKIHNNSYSLYYRLALCSAAVVRLLLLMLGFPIWLIKYRACEWYSSFSKWIAILRWGLGLENWVNRIDQPERKQG